MIRLFTPGPVHLPDEVVAAMALRPLYHRSSEFKTLSIETWDRLRLLFGTSGTVAILAGSGTTAIEASIASLNVANAPCLVLQHGRFGDRLANMLQGYGANVHSLSVEWGNAITASAVRTKLAEMDSVQSVWLVHSETSTGVTLDLPEIANVIQDHPSKPLVCVDAVTSTGVHPIHMDAMGVDVAVCGSQKGLMCPPGLGIVALSARCKDYVLNTRQQSTVLHLATTVLAMEEQQLFPWTPPVTLVRALHTALGLMFDERLENVWARHKRVTEALHSGLVDRGYSLFGEASAYGVTVVLDADSSTIVQELERGHGIVVANGQDALRNTVFRIGTCGATTVGDILALLRALDDVGERARNNK